MCSIVKTWGEGGEEDILIGSIYDLTFKDIKMVSFVLASFITMLIHFYLVYFVLNKQQN